MMFMMVEIILTLVVLGMFVVAAACSVLLGASACSKMNDKYKIYGGGQ